MSTLIFWIVLGLLVIGLVIWLMCCKDSVEEIASDQDDTEESASIVEYLSIETGNQVKLLLNPQISVDKLADIIHIMQSKKFSEERKFYQFIYLLIDPLFDQIDDSTSVSEFFSLLNRGQKMVFALHVFDSDIHDVKDINHFIFNDAELILAVLESLEVLEVAPLVNDYERLVQEIDDHGEEFLIDKEIMDNLTPGSEAKKEMYQNVADYLSTKKKIQNYYFDDEFQQNFYGTINTFIKKHLHFFAN